jgi:type I restriction enzyme M protein
MACGIAGFLIDAIKQIKEYNPDAKILPYGQELDEKTHAMAMTALIIQGFETNNIKQGSTLSNDKLCGSKFHYGLANPPFGFPWEKDAKAVLQNEKNSVITGVLVQASRVLTMVQCCFYKRWLQKWKPQKKAAGVLVSYCLVHRYLMVVRVQENQKFAAGYWNTTLLKPFFLCLTICFLTQALVHTSGY